MYTGNEALSSMVAAQNTLSAQKLSDCKLTFWLTFPLPSFPQTPTDSFIQEGGARWSELPFAPEPRGPGSHLCTPGHCLSRCH